VSSSYDSADLLSRVKRLAQRPTSDEEMSDADWYALLTDAQRYYYGLFAVHCPYVLMGAPVLLTSTDGGYTYPFASGVFPLAVEVYDSLTGRLLRPGTYWDSNADYVWESTQIRIPLGATKSFAAGPYARYVATPGDLTAASGPTLVPAHARMLLVYRSVAEWARQGGYRNPGPFEAMELRLWAGVPGSGDIGIMGALKTQNPFYGATAIPAQGSVTFATLSTCDGGYTAI